MQSARVEISADCPSGTKAGSAFLYLQINNKKTYKLGTTQILAKIRKNKVTNADKLKEKSKTGFLDLLAASKDGW